MRRLNEVDKLLSQVETMRRRYGMYLPLNKTQERIIDKKFREIEIFSSNHMEGNQYSLDNTRYLLNTGMPVSGKKFIDSLEIININKAITYMDSLKGIELSEPIIKKLHSIVTSGTLDDNDDEGRYKQVINYIGDVTTSSPEHTPIHMNKLITNTNKLLKTNENIIKAITQFKYTFLAIHPFIDGNGRTVRLLYNFLLKANGYIPVSILPEDKEEYYEALKDSTKQDSTSLLKFMCKCIIKEYEKRIEFLNGDSEA